VPTRHSVGTVESFPINKVKVVRIQGERVGVVRYRAADNQPDQFYAYEDRCTHDDSPIGEVELEGCEVECPRHGARFDIRDGSVTALPAYGPLEVYPTELADDQVWVQFP
jgi:3-phenylpropionate/trans-cinnamate dioxygenase ferredoxin subunit